MRGGGGGRAWRWGEGVRGGGYRRAAYLVVALHPHVGEGPVQHRRYEVVADALYLECPFFFSIR